MDEAETKRLITELDALPTYEGWCFSYVYPGFFCYAHPGLTYIVAFTPDWEDDQTLPIQVTDEDGECYSEHWSMLPLPRDGRTGSQIFGLVKPTLDALMRLSTAEIARAIKRERDAC